VKISDLFDFCTTDRQREYIQAIIDAPSKAQAARNLNISERVLTRALQQIRERANQQYTPPHDSSIETKIPEGYRIKGVSNMVENALGKPMWVKTERSDIEFTEAIEAYVTAIAEGLPKLDPIDAPLTHSPNLLNQYTITDYHLGMMAWHEETGDDWDMKIAESLLMKWFQSAIKMSPEADTAILANIGDFLHWDGMEAVTPAHRNILDADTRFSKLARVASRCIVQVIRLLLTKHQHVHVIMCDANHDPASQAWFRAWLPIVFENEPRVTVDISPSAYNAYQFGNVGLFFHHGHRRKQKAIDSVFVRQFREIFGSTQHCYAHMGHLHNDTVVESNLMVIEQHRTLAAADAYAASGGWLSGRGAKVITYHKEYGEVARNTITPEMLGF
jgi:hypothetical protein